MRQRTFQARTKQALVKGLPAPTRAATTTVNKEALKEKIEIVCKGQPQYVRNLFMRLTPDNADTLCDHILAEKPEMIKITINSGNMILAKYLVKDGILEKIDSYPSNPQGVRGEWYSVLSLTEKGKTIVANYRSAKVIDAY